MAGDQSTTQPVPRLVLTEDSQALSDLLIEGQHILVRYPRLPGN